MQELRLPRQLLVEIIWLWERSLTRYLTRWTAATVTCHGRSCCELNSGTHLSPASSSEVRPGYRNRRPEIEHQHQHGALPLYKPLPSLAFLPPSSRECLSKRSHLTICPNSRPPDQTLSFQQRLLMLQV